MKRLAALAGVAWLLAAAAPEPAPDRTSAVFGDWETRCANPAHMCELIQGVVDKEHRPILTLAVKPGPSDPVLLVQMPVNVLIAGEMGFGFDKDSLPVPVKLQFCVASGCFASVELPVALRARLSEWGDKPASFNFVSATQTRVTVPVSWRGFGQAFAAMGRPG